MFNHEEMTTELPIINSPRTCKVDPEYAYWFADKGLFWDDEGVFYITNGRKYYVHDQVIVIATKDGYKEPPRDKRMLNRFIRTRCDPDVQNYWKA